MIKNIIFDIGNVLAAFRWADYIRRDLGFSEEVVKVFGEKIVVNPLWDELDLGIRDEKEIIEEMKSRVPEYQKEADAFFENILEIVETYPYSREWLSRLKQEGYHVYLLSNYPRSTYLMHEQAKFDFVPVADGKVISGFEKMAKPDPRIYRLLMKRYVLQPEECVFLDDRQVNIDAAVALGMQGIVFTGYEEANAELERLLRTWE